MAWDSNNKSSRITLTNSDRTATTDGTANVQSVRGKPSIFEGMHYFEVVIPAGTLSTALCIGFASATFTPSGSNLVGKSASSGVCLELSTQWMYSDNVSKGQVSQTFAAGDVLGVGLSCESGGIMYCRFFKNGSPIGTINDIPSQAMWPCLSDNYASAKAYVGNFARSDMGYLSAINSGYGYQYEQWDQDTTRGFMLVEHGQQLREMSGVYPGLMVCDGYSFKFLSSLNLSNKVFGLNAAGMPGFFDPIAPAASQAEVDAATISTKSVTPLTTDRFDKIWVQASASEALSAGDFVNIFGSGSVLWCRKASATDATKPAHGFVKSAVSNGSTADIYLCGTNSNRSGMTVGAMQYLSTTAGGITATPPSGAGNIIQPLGVAKAATAMRFDFSRPIAVAGSLSIADSGGVATLTGKGFVFNVTAASLSTTTDGATIYFGAMAGLAPQTTAALAKVYVPVACTIKAAYIQWRAATAGTSESFTMYLRKNNSSDTTIASVSNTSAVKDFQNTGLSLSMAAGDYFEIKCVCPTWATNPATVALSGQIYAE